jgi:hypothetical protein
MTDCDIEASKELSMWTRQLSRYPYTEEHKESALKTAEELGYQVISSGPYKGTLQRPWSEITRRLQRQFPELAELSLHRLRGAVNRWLDESVREREKTYQQTRRDQMKEEERLALLNQKKLYAEDPEIRDLINKSTKERRAARADIRITANFRSRFAALLKGGELTKNEYGFSFGLAEQLYRPFIEALAGELDAAIHSDPSTKWVIDHKRPLASYPLADRVNLLGEAWSPTNLEVISESENAKKSSIWCGRRWTYSSLDGDRCYVETCIAWRELYPTVTLTPVLEAYLDGTWQNAEALLKVVGQWQQTLLSNKEYRNQVPIVLENSMLNQRGWRPEAISYEKLTGPTTTWSTEFQEKATDKMLEIRRKNIDAITNTKPSASKKSTTRRGFGRQ